MSRRQRVTEGTTAQRILARRKCLSRPFFHFRSWSVHPKEQKEGSSWLYGPQDRPSVRLSYHVCRSIANLTTKGSLSLSFSLLFSAKRQNRIELTNRMIELLFDQIQIRKLKLYRLVKVCEQATTAGKKNANGVNKPGTSIVETGNVP